MSGHPQGGGPRRFAPAPAPAHAVEPRKGVEELLRDATPGLTSEQRDKLRRAVADLAARIQSGEVPGHLRGNLRAMLASALAETEHRLAIQLDTVLHDPKFQKLEASWRSLKRLVNQASGGSALGDDIQIRVLDAKRSEIESDLMVGVDSMKNVPLESGFFEKIHRNAFNTYGATPFAAIVGDLEFGYEPRDLDLLRKISYVCSAVHAPFLAAAGPKMFDLPDFTRLGNKPQIESKFKGDQYRDWNAFRSEPESRYVGLCMPRFLARRPYKSEDLTSFPYREDVEGTDESRLLWGNAAYLMAGQMVEAFVRDGWCVAIHGPEAGGAVRHLPSYMYETEKDGRRFRSPVETQLSHDEDKVLCNLGFIPLVGNAEALFAVFNQVPSCNLPAHYNDAAVNESAKLSAELPYMLAASRVAHYIKVMATEDIGKRPTKEQYAAKFNEWISQFVLDQPSAPEEEKRRRPLKAAKVEVREVPGSPGLFYMEAAISPHITITQVDLTITLTGKIGQSQG